MASNISSPVWKIVLWLTVSSGLAAQPAPQAAPAASDPVPQQGAGSGTQRSLADAARQQRAQRDGEVPGAVAPAAQQAPAEPQKSLGEIARERQVKRQAEVKVNENDSKALFAEVDEIIDFAAHDSGLPRRAPVKRRLVGQDDVKLHMSAALSDLAATRRVTRSELVLKKFGYLPPDFNLKTYLIDAAGGSVAGYYDFKTKTMNLLNWIGLEEQRPIMAHELTHALQDQNYDLLTWQNQAERPASLGVTREDAFESSARRAVVEGQAMIVFFDYMLKPYGRTLADTPTAMDYLKGKMTQTYDTALVLHHAPLLLKDSAIFPYREGLMFELELLRKGGTQVAFAGAFARPPANTHEVLEPKAYLEGEKTPTVSIPDLSGVLAKNYEAYDSGSMGQLDVRILSQQLGNENDMFTITPNWQGGAYVAVKHRPASGSQGDPVTTADIALLYVSRWKTAEAAERFLDIYQKSLAKRVTVSDAAPWTPSACSNGSACAAHRAMRINTNEGPVFLELLPNNAVFIAQSFGEDTANSLRQVVLGHASDGKTRTSTTDLSFKLLEIPYFQAFQEQVRRQLTESLAGLQLE
jgi:hypothetical protein